MRDLRWACLGLLLASFGGVSGCTMVKPYQRELLAKRIMALDLPLKPRCWSSTSISTAKALPEDTVAVAADAAATDRGARPVRPGCLLASPVDAQDPGTTSAQPAPTAAASEPTLQVSATAPESEPPPPAKSPAATG